MSTRMRVLPLYNGFDNLLHVTDKDTVVCLVDDRQTGTAFLVQAQLLKEVRHHLIVLNGIENAVTGFNLHHSPPS